MGISDVERSRTQARKATEGSAVEGWGPGRGAEPRVVGWRLAGSVKQTPAVVSLPTAGIGPRSSGLRRRELGDGNVQTKLEASQTSGSGGRWGSRDPPPQK